MDNNDIIDLKSVANNKQNKPKKKRKRGDGSKTQKGNLNKNIQSNLNNISSTYSDSENKFLNRKSYSSMEEYKTQKDKILERRTTLNDDFKRTKISKDPTTYQFTGNKDNFKTPYLNGTTSVYKKPMHEKMRDSSAVKGLSNSFKSLLNKYNKDAPNNYRDMLTASSIGVQTKETMAGKITGKLGMNEYTGYNPITKSEINIDYLHNKIDKQFRIETKPTDSKPTLFAKKYLNKFIEGRNERNIEYWKQMHRDETAKSVRKIGHSIDPFDSGENLEYVKQKRLVNDLGEKLARDIDRGPSLYTKSYNEAKTKLSTMSGNEDLASIREKASTQLAEIEKRISSSKNNIKNFFNPIDQKELDSLTSMQSELQERVRRIDAGYGSSRIATNDLEIPKSVGESFKQLNDSRQKLQTMLDNGKDLPEHIRKQTKTHLDYTNKLLAEQDYNPTVFKPVSSGLEELKHVKSYVPSYGMSGFGLGFMNSLQASRSEHAVRSLFLANPFGASSRQAMMDGFGILNKSQRMQLQQARGFGKLSFAVVPGVSALQVGTGILNKEDGGQIFEDLFSTGTSLAGWRTGAALGSVPFKKNSVGRLIGTGLGGVTGMVAGYAIGTAIVGGVRDVISNESQVRSFAKKIATKESSVDQVNTRESLTARQASLQKLAKSGLNDRGLLLGNEASVLAGAV